MWRMLDTGGASREEIEEYLRMRDVCVRGRHVYEHGRMIDNVRVTVWS